MEKKNMHNKLVEQPVSPLTSAASVVMGSQKYLVVLLRLIAMELYKFRRRNMSKVLLLVAFGFIGAIFLFTAIPAWSVLKEPVSDFTPPLCAQQPQVVHCLREKRAPTETERAQYKQEFLVTNTRALRIPGSLERFGFFEIYIFPILVVILVGSMVGGDYSLGTVRLLFTRGPSRLQFLLAKIGAAILCIVPGFLGLLCFAVIEGYVLGALIGIAPSWPGLPMSFLLNFVLIGIVGWFAYGMMALFFSTVGRSTVAGIVGPLVWFALEPIVGAMLSRFALYMSGGLRDFISALPEYFVSSAIAALLQNTQHMLDGSVPAAPLSSPLAWIVLIVYALVFMLCSGWFIVARDVVN
jgi:ABC-type transport system involved in multi-copper enzyme maturation permease subunit